MFVIRRLWHYMKPYKLQFFGAMLATVIMMVSNALEPYIFGLAITRLTENVVDMSHNVPGAGVDFAYIRYVLIVYAIRGVFFYGSSYLGQFFLTNVVQNSIYDLRKDLSDKVNQLPVSYFDSEETGDILSKMTNDVDSISNALQQSFIQLVNGVLGISFAVVMMFWIHWKLAIVLVLIMPLSMFVARYILKKSQPAFNEQSHTLGHLFGFAQEQLSGFTELKVFGMQDESIDVFIERNLNLRNIGFKASFISAMMMPFMVLIANLGYLAVAIVGLFQVFAGALTVGNLMAFISYVFQVNQPIQMISQLTGVIQSAFSASYRVFDFLDEAEETNREVIQTLPEKVRGEVEFRNVRFGYDPEKPLMKDISFKVEPGETVAVVGPTGAGKTTLINLLMRFYEINSGAILIDGVDIQDVSRNELRKHFGMVLQDAWLYTDTIMENIRFGDLEAQDYHVQEAAKIANVDHFIKTLPNGYQMEINEEANNISLGQKQLMTIARAVLSDPDILILDEATSSVDTRLEKLIQEAMDKVMEGRTSFVIAHRLSTIRNADLILVMQDGNIIEKGTHDSLLAAEGFYADLYNSQFNEHTPADIHMEY
ncbi:ABC transporter ATP-binding protein [Facklamia sp. DSM 111018]|uniref:ABC transporter ATP-binding protein n=1 Tax=Facklamia lactis TaxID=2749967 RepID=A0ABS0LNA7_9LACT|nr:ABC transporter ATP-binding protein [Facklamia lactis]MBG9979687.1 ABC transporter ATP-binding protein [Facklamia lactis]MBG9985633.1 ABC transporter ATP-binding protein [Facklamia lactis]